MKYLLALLLMGLAGLEFYYHLSDEHASGALTCIAPQAYSQRASEILQQHLHSHH